MQVFSEAEAQRRFRDVAVPLTRMRRASQSTLIKACIDVATRYNADYAIPLDGTTSDLRKPILTPSLISEAVDIPALRASSTEPQLLFPSLGDKDLGVRSREYADIRRRAVSATWYKSGWDLLKRRAFRQLAAYGWCSMVAVPLHKTRDGNPFPRVMIRNAMTTYADPHAPEELDLPQNVGYVHQLSASAILDRYPQAHTVVPIPTNNNNETEMWDVLEWLDGEYTLIGLLGQTYRDQAFREPGGPTLLLSWYPNRLGIVPAVVPQVVTLDRLVSRLTHMIGKADTIAYLLELDIESMTRSITPDRYALATDGEVPEIVSNDGHWMDGRTGEINLLRNVRQVGDIRGAPDPNNLSRIQMIENNARTETGIAGPVSGNASGMAGALRTGRGIDTMNAQSIDPRVEELQHIMGKAMTVLNEGIIATYKQEWPNKKYTMFSGWCGDRKMVEFVPAKHFESSANLVYYPLPGTDAYGLTVQLAQLVQAELLSRRSARRLHPYVDDADAEEREMDEERIQQLVWQSLAMRAQGGGIPPVDAAMLIREIRGGQSLEDAIDAVDQAARVRQAGEQQGPGGPAAPGEEQGEPPNPALQPGLGNPGEGSEQGAPPPAPPGQPPLDAQAFLQALAQRQQGAGANRPPQIPAAQPVAVPT